MIITSLFLTTTAIVLGYFADWNLYPPHPPMTIGLALRHIYSETARDPFVTAYVFLINLVFDSLTVAVTAYLLRYHVLEQPVVSVVTAVMVDMLIALFCAIGCFWAGSRLGGVLDPPWGDRLLGDDTPFIYASTTLLPTILYLTILLLMIVGKVVLHAARWAGLYYGELATQDDVNKSKPFTILGIFFSIVAAAANAVARL